MKTLKRKRVWGFTIIELMIVIIIVAILLAIAYPSYVKYVRKAHRGDAQRLLMNWAINQEIWRSNNISYTDTLVPTHDDYDFDAPAFDAASYTLTATALNDQVNDVARDSTPCLVLTLTQAGAKTESACWD